MCEIMRHPIKDTPQACFTHEILFRLRWNIFHDLNAIEVEEGLDENGVELRSPLSSHKFANELLFKQPFNKMRIFSQDLESIAGTIIEATLRTPAPNAHITTDGPITILDLVKEVHMFIGEHEDAIRNSRKSLIHTTTEDGNPVNDTKVGHKPNYYFKQAFINQHDDELFVYVHIFGEGQFGTSLEKFFNSQRCNAVGLHEKRLEILEAQNAQPASRIRLDVLSRLRWPVSGAVEDIKIRDEGSDTDTASHRSFLETPLARESLFDPPLTRLDVVIRNVLDARAYQMESDRYPYEPLVIENTNDSLITIGDLIKQVHTHLEDHEAFMINYRRAMGFNTFYDAVKANTNGHRMETKTITESRLYVKYVVSWTAFSNVQVRIGCVLDGEFEHAMGDLHRAGESLVRNDVECATLRHGD